MMPVFYIIFSLTLNEIQKNIIKNFSWINNIQGNMEIKINLIDTSFTLTMKFYMEKTEKGKRIKIESEGEKIILKDNKLFFKNTTLSLPLPPDTEKIFPEGKTTINSKDNIIEINCTPEDTNSYVLNYKFYIDKENFLIKSTEITTKLGVIYTTFEYENYPEGKFYKKIKILSQNGIVTEINYKNININKKIPPEIWE